MTLISKFTGRVNKFNSPPEPSYVTIKDTKTNEIYNTDAVSQKLLEAGIDHDGCEFEIIVNQSVDGNITASINKLEPNLVTPEQVEIIYKEVDNKLGNFNKYSEPATLEEAIERLHMAYHRIQELEELIATLHNKQ